MYKILIVEDNMTIAETVSRHLEKWDLSVRYITNFHNIMSTFVSYQPDMVLMDISLPYYNGYHWCQEIRKVSRIPIIFLSSVSENMNIVMAMNMGGDDFIPKPFDLNVLTAKVQAILRRTYDFSGNTNLIEHKGAILNVNDATLSYNEQTLELTKNDFKILQILFDNRGKIVSRDNIMEHLWQTNDFIDDNTLTVNVTRIRKKLEQIGLQDFIITKKGIGYMV